MLHSIPHPVSAGRSAPNSRSRRAVFAGLAIAVGLAALALAAVPSSAAEKKRPIPRFVAVKTGKVNVRTGPGARYPVQWVLRRRYLPLLVIAEFETWRRVRDWEGATGWVHQATLTGRRTVIVTGRRRVLRRRPADNAPAVAHLEPKVIARLLACGRRWCRVQVKGHRGWLARTEFWGVRKGEVFK
ncbi:MAG: SH3 domain-containing protein [Alphaproteobacteria bacterium]|nr:SH3 domain-containing protein [Alphaproteobacteria bacterium]